MSVYMLLKSIRKKMGLYINMSLTIGRKSQRDSDCGYRNKKLHLNERNIPNTLNILDICVIL